MVKSPPKISALVVSAIRNLREIHGSTSQEIMNYIMSQYDASEPTVKRQVYAALKRGLDYGILKRTHGHYSLNIDPESAQVVQDAIPMDRGRRRRRRRRRGGRRRGGKGKKGGRRRRRRGRGRRGRKGRKGGRRRGRRHEDVDLLATDPLEHRQRICYERSRTCSRNNSRSRSRSRSSGTSDREHSIDRHDKQITK